MQDKLKQMTAVLLCLLMVFLTIVTELSHQHQGRFITPEEQQLIDVDVDGSTGVMASGLCPACLHAVTHHATITITEIVVDSSESIPFNSELTFSFLQQILLLSPCRAPPLTLS